MNNHYLRSRRLAASHPAERLLDDAGTFESLGMPATWCATKSCVIRRRRPGCVANASLLVNRRRGTGYRLATSQQSRRLLAKHPDWKVVALDSLTYAGNPKNLEPELGEGRCIVRAGDICDPKVVEPLRGCDAVIHFAAESHVDRSIEDPGRSFAPMWSAHTNSARPAARRERPALRAGLDRRGVWQPGGRRPVHRGDTAAAEQPVLGEQGGADCWCVAYVHTLNLPGWSRAARTTTGRTSFRRNLFRCSSRTCGREKVPLYGDGLSSRLASRGRPLRRAATVLERAGRGRGLQHRRRLRDEEYRRGQPS